MGRWTQVLITIVLTGSVLVLGWFMRTPKAQAPTQPSANSANANRNTNQPATIQFSTADLPDRDSRFDFRLTLPADWAADTLDGGRVIRLYALSATQPAADANVAIMIQSTLPSANSSVSTIDGASATWFTQRTETIRTTWPAWLGTAHREAWLPVNGQTGVYYVFAQGPRTSASAFDTVVNSWRFGQAADDPSSQLN